MLQVVWGAYIWRTLLLEFYGTLIISVQEIVLNLFEW